VNRALAVALALAAAPAVAGAAPPAPPPDPPGGASAGAPAPVRVLSLDEALQLGLARQPQLRQAQASTEAARARADQALAPLLPQLSGSASVDRSSATAGGALSGSSARGGGGTQDLYLAGLTGRLLLWDFGQTSGRWRAVRAAAAGQEQSERGTVQAVALGIRTAYFDAVAAKALVGVARDTLANQERHLEQIRAFVEVGTRPAIDLASERSSVANSRVRLIQAENDYATARVRVEQAVGVTDLGPWEVAEAALPPVPGEEAAPEVLLAEALSARPELAALQQQLRGQELTVGALQGGYGPSLGLSAGVSESGPRASELSTIWSGTLTLTWPLFQGGQTRGQVREARAGAAALEAQIEQLRQQVRVEVEQARLGVRAAGAALVATRDATEAARERLALAEGRYETGVGNVLELGDAQVALTIALGQQVQAEFQLATARSLLLRALGRP
jgi:outer membrane protein